MTQDDVVTSTRFLELKHNRDQARLRAAALHTAMEVTEKEYSAAARAADAAHDALVKFVFPLEGK